MNKTRLQMKAAKQRRQKMIAIGGSVLLALILIIQVPRTLKMLHGSSPTPSTPSATTVPAPVAGATAQPVAAPPRGQLPDRNAAPVPEDGQLTGFELFASKDPFVQQVREASAVAQTAAGAPAPTGQSSTATAASAPTSSQTASSRTTATRSLSAVITVNGQKETVQVSHSFPAGSPTFTLVSTRGSSAKIGVAGGKLADGAHTVTLTVGRKLTLVNTVDGTRYELLLDATE